MKHELWDGTAEYTREDSMYSGTIIIRIVQGINRLVTIHGLGQGKVKFDNNGSFHGCWAMEDHIFDVNGRAEADISSWKGRFKISNIENGEIVVNGSFKAEKKSN